MPAPIVIPGSYKTSSGSPRRRCNATGNLIGDLFATLSLISMISGELLYGFTNILQEINRIGK
jgi:hypothetical protein